MTAPGAHKRPRSRQLRHAEVGRALAELDQPGFLTFAALLLARTWGQLP